RAAPIPADAAYPAGTPFRAQYRVVDGTRLRMIDTGRGTPVVFIHGFGASLYSWRKTLPPVVTAGYRVTAVDNRGFGFSENPAGLSRSRCAGPGVGPGAAVDQYSAPVQDPAYGRALRGVLRQFRFDTLVGRLAGVDVPTLVVWGAADRWIPLRVGTRLASDLP